MGKHKLTADQLDDAIRQMAEIQHIVPIKAFGRSWYRIMAQPSEVKDLIAAGRITVAEDDQGKEWYLVPAEEESNGPVS